MSDLEDLLDDMDGHLKRVQDDLGRFHGSDWANGGAGYLPADPGPTLARAGIPATFNSVALGKNEPVHMTTMKHADVHQKLLAVGHRHQSRRNIDTETNVYDDGEERIITQHVGDAGTAIKGFRKKPPEGKASDSAGDRVQCPECDSHDVKETPNRGISKTFKCNACGHAFGEDDLD